MLVDQKYLQKTPNVSRDKGIVRRSRGGGGVGVMVRSRSAYINSKVISYPRFSKNESGCFRIAKPVINPYRPENVFFFQPFFSDIIFGAASIRKWSPTFGQHRRPKLASGFGFPHIAGGTSFQMSRKQQHSSTSGICSVLL